MITVNCREVESIKHELLIYVSDQVAAIPAIKLHEFILSPIDNETIEQTKVISAIKEFLESIGESRNFAVISNINTITIKSISGKTIKRDSEFTRSEMFSCPHCGFMTQYEIEYNNHKKIHYL